MLKARSDNDTVDKIVECFANFESETSLITWIARVASKSNIADTAITRRSRRIKSIECWGWHSHCNPDRTWHLHKTLMGETAVQMPDNPQVEKRLLVLCTVWEWISLCPSRQSIIHETNEIRCDFKCLWNYGSGRDVEGSCFRSFVVSPTTTPSATWTFTRFRAWCPRLEACHHTCWVHHIYNPQPKRLCRCLDNPQVEKRLLVLCTVWEWIMRQYFKAVVCLTWEELSWIVGVNELDFLSDAQTTPTAKPRTLWRTTHWMIQRKTSRQIILLFNVMKKSTSLIIEQNWNKSIWNILE